MPSTQVPSIHLHNLTPIVIDAAPSSMHEAHEGMARSAVSGRVSPKALPLQRRAPLTEEAPPCCSDCSEMPSTSGCGLRADRMHNDTDDSIGHRFRTGGAASSAAARVGREEIWDAALRSRSPDLLLSIVASRGWPIEAAAATAAAARLAELCRPATVGPNMSEDGRGVIGLLSEGAAAEGAAPRSLLQQHVDHSNGRCRSSSNGRGGYCELGGDQRQQYLRFLERLRDLFPSRTRESGEEGGGGSDVDPGGNKSRLDGSEAALLIHSLALMGRCGSQLASGVLQAVEEGKGCANGSAVWVMLLSARQTNRLAWSLATLRLRPRPELLGALYARTMPLLPTLGPGRASSLLWSLSRLRGVGKEGSRPPPPPEWWAAFETATRFSSRDEGWPTPLQGSSLTAADQTLPERRASSEAPAQTAVIPSTSTAPLTRQDLPSPRPRPAGGAAAASPTPGQAVALIWAAARLRPEPRPSDAWVRGLLSSVGQGRLSSLSARECDMLMAGLAALRFRPPDGWVRAMLLMPRDRRGIAGSVRRVVRPTPRRQLKQQRRQRWWRTPSGRARPSCAAPRSEPGSGAGHEISYTDVIRLQHEAACSPSAVQYGSILRSAARLRCYLPSDELEVAAEIVQVCVFFSIQALP